MSDAFLESAHIAAYWAALALSIAAFALALLRRPQAKLGVAVALALLTVSIALRWALTAHPPIFGSFENTLASAWAALLFALALPARLAERTPRTARPLLAGWAAIVLAVGAFLVRTPLPLTISERSLWVDLHALAAWLAFTCLLLASLLAAALLLRLEKDGVTLDEIVLRLTGVGFAFLTVMMAVGSYYSFLLFADWYRWEIVGILAAATWLGYGLAVHLRLFFGWRGRKLAAVLAAMLPLLLAVFWVWSFYPATYHFFDIVEIRAF